MNQLSNKPRAAATTITWLASLVLPWLFSQAVQANETLITARIDGTQFINTTPKAQWCAQFASGGYCTNRDWGIDLPITFTKVVDVNSPDVRNKVYAQLPARQAITLQNQLSGQTATMSIAFNHFSQRVSWRNETVLAAPIGGCGGIGGIGSAPGVWSQHLWYTLSESNPAPCYSSKSGNATVENSQFSRIGVSIRPEFPSPASLNPGRWEGIIDYPVGPGRGFDFGNLTSATTDVIRFRVSFVVQPDIRVDFPDNGAELRLIPQGGWGATVNSSRAPERLYYDSPLRLWAASPVRVYLGCQLPNAADGRCNLRPTTGRADVPMDTQLTLPGTFTHNNQPVNRLSLRHGVARAKTIVPSGNISNAPGTLHFEVSGADAAKMLLNPGAKYSGTVTIIYDATIA
jgi:hypothetical protein